MAKDLEKSKGLTEEAKFEPTPHMEKWLAVAVEMATDSPTAIAEESKISKQSWYNWIEKPGFEEWYYASYKQKRSRWLPRLDSIGMKYAKRGEYQFWKDMNKKAGENLDTQSSTNIQVNVTPILEGEEVHVSQDKSD